MLKIIQNKLTLQAEKIITEEQAGFSAGRSTTKQIFNLRILCDKYLQHQQDLYHVAIDFKKASDTETNLITRACSPNTNIMYARLLITRVPVSVWVGADPDACQEPSEGVQAGLTSSDWLLPCLRDSDLAVMLADLPSARL